jgi:hypothetical protein
MFVTIRQHIARLALAASVFIVIAAFQVLPVVQANPSCGTTVPGC